MVLIDDFLNNGTDQVCLLQESAHIDQIFKGFVLCNFNGVNIASDQKPLSGECSLDKTSNSESLHSTIQALRARLQTCNAYFYEVRTMCNNKKAMIGKTCKTLQRLTGISETQENFNTSSLVCLIGDDTYEEKPKDVCKQQSPEVTPIDIWQRVISDKWVIAVEFKYTDKSNISDVTLSMVSSTKDYLKSSCEPKLQSQILRPGMLVHKQEILKPPSKRQKLDEIDQNSGVVTMVTTIPTFSKESRFTGLLVLSWTCCHDNEVTSRYVSCCGYVHLDIDQLISGDLSISGRKSVAGTNQDLIALKAISIQTMVSFNHISTPSNVISVLQRELDLVPISDITAAGSKEILLKACNVTGLLEGVAMLVDCSNDRCIVRLFTRNENQVYIIISRLRHALPADVTIHVRQAINGSSDSQFHMQNQLDHVKSDIQKTLLNKQQTLSKELDDSKCNVTKIGTIRSRFEERRKVFSFASRHPVKKL